MIESRQIAADFTGRYPEKLDNDAFKKLMKEITGAITSEDDRPAAQQWREELRGTGSKEAAMRASMGRSMKLMSLMIFPLMLTHQGAEPVYHGDIVTPDDADLPLMCWKVPEGGYRVIFGDLHAETVTAEVLAELEAALPQ